MIYFHLQIPHQKNKNKSWLSRTTCPCKWDYLQLCAQWGFIYAMVTMLTPSMHTHSLVHTFILSWHLGGPNQSSSHDETSPSPITTSCSKKKRKKGKTTQCSKRYKVPIVTDVEGVEWVWCGGDRLKPPKPQPPFGKKELGFIWEPAIS